MRWFIPSFSGDFRLDPIDGQPDRSVLTILKPTLGEAEILQKFFAYARKKAWTDFDMPPA